MSRDDFLRELKSRIGHLPQEEQDAAMEYYREYFDECGDDAAAWEALGSPAEAAARILGEEKNEEKREPEGPFGWLFGVLDTPIRKPLLYIVGVLLMILSLAGFLLLLEIGVLTANMLTASAKALYISLPTALFGLGVGLLAIGLMILVACGLLRIMKSVVKGVFLKRGV